MKLAIDIIQSLLLPKLEKDVRFDANQTNIAFWETFTFFLLDFEKDAKPVYAAIYSLGLNDSERIITKLASIYASFIKELAENHVLGISSEAIAYLITSKNSTFEKEVHFFTDLQNAIKKVERKRIKKELPTNFEKLTFEIDGEIITNVVKKKSREDLKKKMAGWDEALVAAEEVPVYSVSTKKEAKIISLSWIKYASIAAIFISGFMIWQPNKSSNDELFAQYNNDDSVIKSIDYQKMTIISESSGTRGEEKLFQNYSNSETVAAIKAIEQFKNDNFEKSRQILTILNPRERNNQLLLFLAIAQLKTNHIEQAVSNLEYINKKSNYEYADDVKFHLALGYIKQNEKRKAKDLLVALVSKDSKYSMHSQEILNNMRWF